MLGIDRIYGTNVITKMEVMLLKGEVPGGQSSWLGTLNSLGQEVWEEVFYFGLTVFPPFYIS